jgi:ABC-type transport system substrate-binding protein
VLGVLAAVALVATTGCGSGTSADAPPVTPAPKPRAGGRMAVGLESDPNGIDPVRNAWDPAALSVANAIYDPWFAFDANGEARPYLAQDLTPNADFTVWTLRIRPGVRFHDGTPLNADATIKWWIATTRSAITGPAETYYDHFDKVDDLTVAVTFNRPWASLRACLTTQGGYVPAPAQLDDPEGSLHPIGTGPFKLTQWVIGQRVSVAKNPDYWRAGLPYLDQVDFVVAADGDQRVKDLRSATLDVIYATHPSETAAVARLGPGSGVVVERDQGATDAEFMMFNTVVAPFDDVRVRRAVALATDVPALAAANGWSAERLGKGPFSPGSRWFADVAYPGYDPERARALVREYEAEKGPVTFTVNAAYEIGVVQQLVEQWARVGLRASVNQIEFKTHVILIVAGLYQATLLRYFAAQDPDTLWHFWVSETIKPVNSISLNFTRLSDAEIDRNLTLGRTSTDLATRQRAYAVVQQRFADLVPYVWLNHTLWTIARRDTVHDARNVTLPDGSPSLPYEAGVFRAVETWVA